LPNKSKETQRETQKNKSANSILDKEAMPVIVIDNKELRRRYKPMFSLSETAYSKNIIKYVIRYNTTAIKEN
jgi:hypothetical protein